jgi:hypothetical protein
VRRIVGQVRLAPDFAQASVDLDFDPRARGERLAVPIDFGSGLESTRRTGARRIAISSASARPSSVSCQVDAGLARSRSTAAWRTNQTIG